MEELNQKSIEAEAVDLAPLGLDVSFRPSDFRAISSREIRVDKVAEGWGLSNGKVDSAKHARNVGVRGSRLLGSSPVGPTQGGRGQPPQSIPDFRLRPTR
jgi:hypothetical protein